MADVTYPGILNYLVCIVINKTIEESIEIYRDGYNHDGENEIPRNPP
jgi:hypothetical protein